MWEQSHELWSVASRSEQSTTGMGGQSMVYVGRLVAVLGLLLGVWQISTRLSLRSPGVAHSSRTSRHLSAERPPWAYMTVVCGEENVKSAMVLVHSVKNSKTVHDVVVLTYNVSESTRQIFAALGAKVDPLPPRAAAAEAGERGDEDVGSGATAASLQLVDVSGECLPVKFRMWSMVQYEKVIYLDTLMLLLENIDDVFDRSQLTAAPDNDLPDRFNPSLMLLEPLHVTYLALLNQYSRLHSELAPGFQDLLFFNHFFSNWPKLGRDHHLEYGYNALSKLGYSATWNEWVHPNLKVVRFVGRFERWDDMVDKHYPPTRRYDHLRWEVLRDMYSFLVKQGLVPADGGVAPPICHTDYMLYAQGAPIPRKLSVIIRFRGQVATLLDLVRHFSAMRFVYKIYVLPMDYTASRANLPATWNTSRPVEVLPGGDFTVVDHYRPIETLATDCLLFCEDSIQLSSTVLASAFKYWLEHPHRLVGFFPSAHYRDSLTAELVYVGRPRGEYSMTSARLLMLHSDYLQSFSCSLSEAVKEYVNRAPECEDPALNFLTTHLSGTPPLLMSAPDKRILDDVSTHLNPPMKLRSACLNDLEAMMGLMPLRNTSEAKLYLEHDVFTKQEFADPLAAHRADVALTSPLELEFEPIFDATPTAASDENFRFMASIPRVSSLPEVIVVPSPQQPRKVLCLQGNSSIPQCQAGANCTNRFAMATYQSIPPNALLLLGTSLILHSRYGFDDRFHTPNIIANLFYPYPDYGFMKPARALFYKKGSLESRLPAWTRLLMKSLMGDHIAPFRLRNAEHPVCFERAVMTRRYRPVAAERNVVLREMRERAWAYCSALAHNPPPSTLPPDSPLAPHNWQGFKSWENPGVLKVLLLHGDEDTGYAIIKNLDALVAEVGRKCNAASSCELLVRVEQNFTNFCQQVLHMGAADAVITVSGDGTMNHIIFMRPQMKVLELVPFGLRAYDPRVLKVYQEAARWIGVDHTSLPETKGPPCPTQDNSCRFWYRRRAMEVSVSAVLSWLPKQFPQLGGGGGGEGGKADS